jgi:hypothetical protein
MPRNILFGSFLTIAFFTTGSFAQETVTLSGPVPVSGPVEVKQPQPPASRYETLLKTPGKVVISNKYAIGDSKLRTFARVSHRENTPSLKVYTFHQDSFSIDFEKIPSLIGDLETFVELMKAAEANEGVELHFRYSDDYYVRFYSYRDDKDALRQTLYLYPGSFAGQGAGAKQQLDTHIQLLKQGYAKLAELKRSR